MPEFTYVARELSGKQVQGTLSAADENDVLAQLSTRKLFPVKVAPAKAASKLPLTGTPGKVSSNQLAMMYSQLSDLLGSGVALLRSLQLIADQTSSKSLKSVLLDVRDQVANGRRLAEAMRRHPRTFSDLVISLIEAGEEGSFVEDVLKRLAIFTQHQNEMKSKVVGAMIYPVFLLVFGGIVVVFMLIYFVPKFQPIFDRLKETGGLPTATTLLMGMSDVLQKYWLLLALVVAGIYYGVQRFLASERGQYLRDQFLLAEVKIGATTLGLGPVFKNLAIARFCRVLGTLLANGVPVLRSMAISKNATGNLVLRDEIAAAAERISSGKSLAQPLSTSKHFPADVVELIAVGEESNRLETVLIDIADSIERRTQRNLELIVRMLEPIMLLFLAGVVLFMVMALLLPILQSSTMF